MNCFTSLILFYSLFVKFNGKFVLGEINDCNGCSSGGSISSGDCYAFGHDVDSHGNSIYGVFGCYGSFSGGMDDNSVDLLCNSNNGYHVCDSALDAFTNGLTENECLSVGNNEIFLLRESSFSNGECESVYNTNGNNNIYGCSGNTRYRNDGIFFPQCRYLGITTFSDCLSMSHICGYWENTIYDTSILNTGNDNFNEYNNVRLNNPNNGGVLCCKDEGMCFFNIFCFFMHVHVYVSTYLYLYID